MNQFRQQLIIQNSNLKQELKELKIKYSKLKDTYRTIAKKYSDLLQQKHQNIPLPRNSMVKLQKQISFQSNSLEQDYCFEQQDDQLESVSLKGRQNLQSSIASCLTDKTDELNVKRTISFNCKIEKKTSSNLHKKSSMMKQNLTQEIPVQLTECSFIFQNSNKLSLDQCLKFCYPETARAKYKQHLELLIQYCFQHTEINQIEDDEFGSRINEIKYGSDMQDLFYTFETNEDCSKLPIILKKMHAIPKTYAHVMIQPQILQINGITYETAIAYGFLSKLPTRPIFTDLNRTLLHEVKYQQMQRCNGNIGYLSKNDKIKILSNVMQKISSFEIIDFPIQGAIKTGLMEIDLNITSSQEIASLQSQNLNQMAKKVSKLVLAKLVHYILTQQQVIIVGQTRLQINEMLQILRLSIYPFNWMFPILYDLSQKFHTYLSTPLPILIGCLQSHYKSIPSTDMIIINLDPSKDCYNQILQYQKAIDNLHKDLQKNHQKIGNTIKKYIVHLRKLSQKKMVEQQLTQFHEDFIATQISDFYQQRTSLRLSRNSSFR